jgi:hypothetical protein
MTGPVFSEHSQRQLDMVTSLTENTLAFIVRVWRETREIEGAAPEWRGVVEHVPTGERRYLTNLDELADFILLYVPDIRRHSE